MNQLQNFGYPAPGDNVSFKPAFYSDYYQGSGTGIVSLFNNAVDNTLRNKKFPLQNEIFVLKEIFIDTYNISHVDVYECYVKSYFQIIKNNKEVLKINLIDLANMQNTFIFGGQTNLNIEEPTKPNGFKLQIPIIINSNDDVQFKMFLFSRNLTGPGSPINLVGKLTLAGFTLDKLQAFEFDERKEKNLENLAYVLYDVVPLTSFAQTNYQVFNTEGKTENLFSKGINLKDETFQLQNIEIYGFGNSKSYKQSDFYNSMQSSNLIIKTDSKEVLNINNSRIFSRLAVYDENVKTSDVQTLYIKLSQIRKQGLALHKPIIFKANSLNSVELKLPQLYSGGAEYGLLTGFIVVCFKGVLTRKVS